MKINLIYHVGHVPVLGRDTFHYLKKKKKGKRAYMILKLDMMKVYDCMEWIFLHGVLRHKPFAFYQSYYAVCNFYFIFDDCTTRKTGFSKALSSKSQNLLNVSTYHYHHDISYT